MAAARSARARAAAGDRQAGGRANSHPLKGVVMRIRVWCALALAVVTACGDGSVEPPVPAALRLAPAEATLGALGDTVRFAASVVDDAGQTMPNATVQWTTLDPAVAVVDADGVVAAVGNGTTVVSATSAGLSATAAVTVAQVVARVSVEPGTVTLEALGDTIRMTARAEDRNGHPVEGATFAWSSSDASAVDVDDTGLATAIGNGTADIAVAAGEASAMAAVTVAQVVAQVFVEPGAVTLEALGDTIRMTARAEDRNGHPVEGATFAWSSSDASAVDVDGTGLATAIGNGTADIAAEAGEASAMAAVTVAQVVAQVFVEPGTVTLEALGDTIRMTARAEDRNGHPVEGATFAWSSSDASAVHVDDTGLATAVGNGSADIAAEAAEVSATATVTVRQAPAALKVVAGSGQRARVRQTLGETVTVAVEDGGGSPVAGVEVAFSPGDAGHGSVDPSTAVSDSAGRASTIWTLGDETGVQTLVARVGDVAERVSAEALPPLPVVAFANGAASAPEGGTAVLTVVASPPPPAPITVRYELVADEDPATADADADDHAAPSSGTLRFGATDTTAVVEIAIRDDDRIEPPREVLLVRLLPSEDAYELGASSAVVEIDEGVCDRTPEIADAIVGAVDRRACSGVTGQDLANILELRVAITWSPERGHHGGVTSLMAGDFDGLSKLRTLIMNHHAGLKQRGDPGLTELPVGVFDGLTSLQLLRLAEHSLTDLPPGTWSDLRNLTNLDLARNDFGEIPANMFAGLDALEGLALWGAKNYLHLSEASLKALDEDAFAGLSGLRRLVLGHNALTKLPRGVFRHLQNLQSLDLGGNDLRALPGDLFAGLSHLENLNLGANQLSELPSGIFGGLHSLETFSLAENPGAPFELTLRLARVDTTDRLAAGPATVAVTLEEGAPLPVAVPLLVSNGTAADTVLALAPGETTGQGLRVRPSADAGRATFLGLGAVPTHLAPELGVTLTTGDPLVLFSDTRNRAPTLVEPVKSHILQAGGPRATVNLSSHFSDPDGDRLTYTARGEAALLDAWVTGDRVRLVPHGEGEATLLLTARDSEGFIATQRVRVVVLPAPDPNAFNIDFVFVGHRSGYAERMVTEAAERWMELVTGDLPGVSVAGDISPPGRSCYVERREYEFHGVIDDLLVFVGIEDPMGAAGRGGPCLLRESSLLPYVGGITISPRFISEGTAGRTIAAHEFGHALGFGTIWNQKGLLKNPTWREGLGADTHFSGPLAIEAFNAAGGTDFTGSKVPVENWFSVDAHWHSSNPYNDPHRRASILNEELMEGFGGEILSAITVQSLADLGYEVDPTKAEPYRLYNQPVDGAVTAMDVAGAGEAEQAGIGDPDPLDLTDDIHMGFLAVADENGRIVRILRR